MEIRWSVPAAEDLERICQRIERDNPKAAARVAKTIYDGCAQLSDFPNLGRISRRMSGRRELTFASLPYIAVYQLKQHTTEISRIFHAAQDWP
ncbi:MAG: type II toxin-antitoxin system RelE/ParE family toxin [Terriglobia bacterium]